MSAVSSWKWSFDEDLRFWVDEGIERVGLSLRKCEESGIDAASRRVRDAGLRVSNVVECGWLDPSRPQTWARQRDRLLSAIAAFAGSAPWCLVLTTGPAGSLEWDAAADALYRAWEPVLDAARDAGVTVAIENTGSLRVDLSFVLTLADALDLATMLDAGVCVELQSCWGERGLAGTFSRAGARLAHVQVSDFVVGSLCTPDRAVTGDGDIPLERLFAELQDARYTGVYELELVGPRIESEGYASAIRRSLAHLNHLFEAKPRESDR